MIYPSVPTPRTDPVAYPPTHPPTHPPTQPMALHRCALGVALLLQNSRALSDELCGVEPASAHASCKQACASAAALTWRFKDLPRLKLRQAIRATRNCSVDHRVSSVRIKVASQVRLAIRRYKFEDKQVVDYVREATKKNIWYYRDRMSVPRGPCSLPVLRECWVRPPPAALRAMHMGALAQAAVRQYGI